MDINGLTTIVMQKFQDNCTYKEISDNKLHNAIHRILKNTYDQERQKISDQLKIKEKHLGKLTNECYEEEYDKIEDIVLTKANEIAAVKKEEL